MISPTYDERHDRVTEDALLLELMELLRECGEEFEKPIQEHRCVYSSVQSSLDTLTHDDDCPGCEQQSRRANLVKRIEEVLK